MREEQVIDTLKNLSFKKKALPKKYKIEEGNMQDSLTRLEKSGKIKKVEYRKKVFWLTMEEKRGHDQSET